MESEREQFATRNEGAEDYRIVQVDEVICQSRYHAVTPWYVDHDSNSVKPGFKLFVIAAWQVVPDTVIVNVFTRSLNSILLTRVFASMTFTPSPNLLSDDKWRALGPVSLYS
jgi:hypothetical protein